MSRARSHRQQHGVALIAAIFVLVVLAALALFMLNLSGTQHFTSMWAVQGARAHYAAQSGLEWGAWQALNGGGCNNPALQVDAGASQPFNVDVACTSSTFVELGATRTVWSITATATYGGAIGSIGFVQRQQRATVIQ
jgi:MSHA biogenesis protein MshP